MPQPLSASQVIEKGGWSTRYAKFVGLASWDRYAIAVVDGDGSGRELDIEQWMFDGTCWVGGTSSGAGSLDDLPSCTGAGWEDHYVFAVGKAEPNSPVRLRQGDTVVTATTSSDGVWVCLMPPGPPLALDPSD